MKVIKDIAGIKLKYPFRTCKQCGRYPCFEGINLCKCEFASYGCTLYKDGSFRKISSK